MVPLCRQVLPQRWLAPHTLHAAQQCLISLSSNRIPLTGCHQIIYKALGHAAECNDCLAVWYAAKRLGHKQLQSR